MRKTRPCLSACSPRLYTPLFKLVHILSPGKEKEKKKRAQKKTEFYSFLISPFLKNICFPSFFTTSPRPLSHPLHSLRAAVQTERWEKTKGIKKIKEPRACERLRGAVKEESGAMEQLLPCALKFRHVLCAPGSFKQRLLDFFAASPARPAACACYTVRLRGDPPPARTRI